MRLLLFCFGVLLVQCSRAPADRREWRATDHDHAAEPVRGQVDVSGGSDPRLLARGVDEVIIATWRAQCMRCHGMAGHGDGPEGRRWQVPDFSRPAWQSGVTDEQIAKVLVAGKGAMPPSRLPDMTVAGLVRLVRSLGAPAPRPSGSVPMLGSTRPPGTASPPEASRSRAGINQPTDVPVPRTGYSAGSPAGSVSAPRGSL
jgi:hypothetical protein